MTRTPWQERIWTYAEPNEAGCWIWTHRTTDKDGYGWLAVYVDGAQKMRRAHRLAYEVAVGPIPAGLEIDHLCNVPGCINPRHLEVVTHAENLRRRSERQTHCARGHERTPESTYVAPSGSKRCRPCDTAKTRRYRAERKEVSA